jgi:two-component system phosphate regulon response regulator PhoB
VKILQQGLDALTIEFLRQGGALVETPDETLTNDDLPDWLSGGSYEAFIFDLEKGGLGLYAPRLLRAKAIIVPVIGISRPGEGVWQERVATFLEQGGDYLLRGPANPRELSASLRAATRRFMGSLIDVLVYKIGEAVVKINQASFLVTINGKAVELGPSELRLLLYLSRSGGRVRSREQILEACWETHVDDRTVDVHIGRLRKGLANAHKDAEGLVETFRSGGYGISLAAITEKAA